jgi:hypothetical protein
MFIIGISHPQTKFYKDWRGFTKENDFRKQSKFIKHLDYRGALFFTRICMYVHNKNSPRRESFERLIVDVILLYNITHDSTIYDCDYYLLI